MMPGFDITPEMIEAGRRVLEDRLYEHVDKAVADQLVIDVFSAMLAKMLDQALTG